MGYIPSFRTGRPAEIRIRMVRLEMENIRKKLGMPLSGAMQFGFGKGNKNPLTTWGINTEGQGFSIVRNGREIRSSETLQLFTRDNKLNYFRGEVEFDDELDSLFKVQTNKSRFTISKRLRDIMRDRCMATIQQIRNDNSRVASLLKIRRQRLAAPSSEQAAALAAANPKFKRRKISDAQKKKAEQEIAERVESMVRVAEKEGESEIKAAEEVLDDVRLSRDKKRIEAAESAVESAKVEAIARVKTIRDRFAFSSPCRKFYGKVGNGDIYSIEDLDTEVWVTINTESPFYKILYERATQKPEMESLLDLILFAIAHSEHLQGHSDKMLEFWNHARNRVSRNAYTFVSRMSMNDSDY